MNALGRLRLAVLLSCALAASSAAAGCGQDGAPKTRIPVTAAGGAATEEPPPEEEPEAEGGAAGAAGKGAGSGKGGASGRAGGAGKGGAAGKAGAGGTAGKSGASGASGGTGGTGGGSAGKAGAPPAATPLALRIGNYNAENVFNDVLENPSSSIEKENTPSTADYQAKLVATAGVLQALGADIVMLQEIENEAVLADLRAEPSIAGKYGHQALVKGNDTRGIDLGLVSSVPITKVVSHEKESFNNPFDTDVPPHKYFFARDVLEVHFSFNGRHLILLGVHLKAKTGDPEEVLAKQIAEATQTRKIADSLSAQDPSAAIVILGDFNNSPDTQPLQIIAGMAPSMYSSAVAALGDPGSWTVDYDGKDIYDDQYANPLLAGFRDAASASILHLPASPQGSDHAPVAVTYQVK